MKPLSVHGMVRQFQESYFGGRYQSTYLGYSAPDFTKVSSAYGIDSVTVTGADDIEGSLQWLWRDPERPQLSAGYDRHFRERVPEGHVRPTCERHGLLHGTSGTRADWIAYISGETGDQGSR